MVILWKSEAPSAMVAVTISPPFAFAEYLCGGIRCAFPPYAGNMGSHRHRDKPASRNFLSKMWKSP
jgi:hypothetical protein